MQFDWPCLTRIELNLDENNIIRSGYQKNNNIIRSGFGKSKLYTSITYCLNACLPHTRENGFLAFLFVLTFIMMLKSQHFCVKCVHSVGILIITCMQECNSFCLRMTYLNCATASAYFCSCILYDDHPDLVY